MPKPVDLKAQIEAVMKETEKGRGPAEIARRRGWDPALVEQIARLYVTHPGDEDMRMPASFPVVVGSGVFVRKRVCNYPGHEGATFICTGAEFTPGKITFTATDDAGHAVGLAVLEK